MSQVLQTNCDYKIKTQSGGTITLDTSPVAGSNGTVRITGNLLVEGEQLTINTTDLFVEDNIIRLNIGETGNGVTEVYSGIEIDRGFSAGTTRNLFATFWFNESTDSWEIAQQSGGPTPVIRFDNSTLKLRAITTNATTDEGDLTLIGTGTGVIKVEGTINYEQQVTDDDDIPNKRYVDITIRNREPNNRIQRSNSYVKVQDVDGGATGRAVLGVLEGVINQPGLNYQVGDLIYLTSGTYSEPAVWEVTGVVTGTGAISSISPVEAGFYTQLSVTNTSAPTTTNSTNGAGATLNLEWIVRDVEIINSGNDYESANVFFSFNAPAETQAAGTVVIDTNPLSDTFRQITGVTITNGGEYFALPAVTFSAGTPTDLTESQVSVVVEDVVSAVFYENRVEIGGLEIIDNAIVAKAGRTDDNILLDPNGTGKVEINYGIQLNNAEFALVAVANSTVVFGDSSLIGESGVFYNNTQQESRWSQWVINNSNYDATDLAARPVRNELISKNKALVMSMLF
jgi:hypothetical protein